MTTTQQEICKSFCNIRFLPGSFDKRFAHNMYDQAVRNSGKELTELQNEWMYRILYKYRKQVPVMYNKHKNHPFCTRKK